MKTALTLADLLRSADHRHEVGAGRLETVDGAVRLIVPATDATHYHNAQLDDYHTLPRKNFAWRPPLGHLGWNLVPVLLRGPYATVLWSFDAHDSMRHEGRWQEAPEYEAVRAGDIILMHDDNPVCLEDLPKLVTAARSKGLQFVTVSELLGLRSGGKRS